MPVIRWGQITLAVIVLLNLWLKFLGNDWGLNRKSQLQKAGFATESSKSEIIYGSYVFDEQSFLGFSGIICDFPQIAEKFLGGELTFEDARDSALQVAYRGNRMPKNPVAPLVYGHAALLGALVQYGHYPDPDELRTSFYRVGRYLNALISLLLLIPLIKLIGITVPEYKKSPALFFPLLVLAAFQPILFAQSHWITYNLPVALVFVTILLLLWRINQLREGDGLLRHLKFAILLGVLFGFAIGIKYTFIPFFGFSSLFVFYSLCVRNGARKAVGITSLLVLTTAFTYFILILPAVWAGVLDDWYSHRNLVNLVVSDESRNQIHQIERIGLYFVKTLPAAMGWPLYLTGWAGLGLCLYRFRKISPFIRFIVIVTLAYALLYTTNNLGLMVQRSTTLCVFWIIFFFLAVAELRKKFPKATVVFMVYVVAGYAWSCLSMDYYFLKDNPGYHFQASRYLLDHAPKGSRVYLNLKDKDNMVDLPYYEVENVVAERRYYQYEFKYQRDLSCDERGFAFYFSPKLCGVPASAKFESPVKQEHYVSRWVRMFFLHHRLDQVIQLPTFYFFDFTAS